MKRRKRRQYKIVLRIVVVVLILSLLVSAGYTIKTFLFESDFFVLSKIEVKADRDKLNEFKELESIKRIKEKSLFSLDTGRIIRELKKEYPQYKKFIVKKKFPHTLVVEFIKRKPFYQLKIGGFYYLVDKQGIVISYARDSYGGIVEVNTFIPKGTRLAVGERLSLPYSKYISSLIEILNKKGFTEKYEVSSVTVFEPTGVKFDLEGVQIKIGSDNFEDKLRVLDDSIIPQFSKDLNNIAYIDLRFQDYVVGYKK